MNAPTEPVFSLARQREVVAALQAALPKHAVLHQEDDPRPNECYGFAAYRDVTTVVVFT